jgi:hypothetical protein
MRSAPCASAPSHPLHAMPPRITRNSDRPRASVRTMVNIVLLAASCTLELCHQQQRNLMRMGQHAKPLQGSRNRVGWISRKNLFRSRRSFFLDIPFYRTHRPLPGAFCLLSVVTPKPSYNPPRMMSEIALEFLSTLTYDPRRTAEGNR